MKLPGIWRILNRSEPDAKERAPKEPSFQQVLAAPATYNRRARRSIGLYGRFWRWDTHGTEMERTYVPRYIRRHAGRVLDFSTHHVGRGSTRRVRKERARSERIVIAKGLE